MISFLIIGVLVAIASSFMYVGVLMLLAIIVKRVYPLDEMKINIILGYKNGKGLYYILMVCYLVTMIVMVLLSYISFRLVGNESPLLASMVVMSVVIVTGVIKFPKLKAMIQERVKNEFKK